MRKFSDPGKSRGTCDASDFPGEFTEKNCSQKEIPKMEQKPRFDREIH
jgi:hypothetical protein